MQLTHFLDHHLYLDKKIVISSEQRLETLTATYWDKTHISLLNNFCNFSGVLIFFFTKITICANGRLQQLNTQQTFAYSNSTTGELENVFKNNKTCAMCSTIRTDTRTRYVVLVSLLITLNRFHTLFLKQVNVWWVWR